MCPLCEWVNYNIVFPQHYLWLMLRGNKEITVAVHNIQRNKLCYRVTTGLTNWIPLAYKIPDSESNILISIENLFLALIYLLLRHLLDLLKTVNNKKEIKQIHKSFEGKLLIGSLFTFHILTFLN